MEKMIWRVHPEYAHNGPNDCVLKKSYVAILNPTVEVLGGMVFEGWLGH